MADKASTGTKIKKFVTLLANWWKATTDSLMKGETVRAWCMYGYTPESDTAGVTQAGAHKLFDRADLNDTYEERYKALIGRTGSVPNSYVQAEINMIYSIHKVFVERHKTRLQFYRDDAVKKLYRQPYLLAQGLGRFVIESKLAERPSDKFVFPC